MCMQPVNFSEEEQEHEQLKEEVRKMLVETPDNSCKKLELIDAIQRLGVAYHFESEIEASVRSMFAAYNDHGADEEQFMQEDGRNELHTVALAFRLLRHHGHYVSCGKRLGVTLIYLINYTPTPRMDDISVVPSIIR